MWSYQVPRAAAFAVQILPSAAAALSPATTHASPIASLSCTGRSRRGHFSLSTWRTIAASTTPRADSRESSSAPSATARHRRGSVRGRVPPALRHRSSVHDSSQAQAVEEAAVRLGCILLLHFIVDEKKVFLHWTTTLAAYAICRGAARASRGRHSGEVRTV